MLKFQDKSTVFCYLFVMVKKRIILFGGTFDPIHYGHIRVAHSALQQTNAEKVVFIPAQRSPHKKLFPVASGNARLEMITLAITGRDKFCVSDCELKRASPSYTLDTVRSFQVQCGSAAEFYWLVGADMVKDLTAWHKIGELIDQCRLSVMSRAGFDKPDFSGLEAVLGPQRVGKLAENVISTPLVDISGTEIRQKLASGRDIEGLVDAKVLAYIREHRLYIS